VCAAHPAGEDVLDVDDVGLSGVVRLAQLLVKPVNQKKNKSNQTLYIYIYIYRVFRAKITIQGA